MTNVVVSVAGKVEASGDGCCDCHHSRLLCMLSADCRAVGVAPAAHMQLLRKWLKEALRSEGLAPSVRSKAGVAELLPEINSLIADLASTQGGNGPREEICWGLFGYASDGKQSS
eukprot:351323-Chlamydomonas_euryale.AAC.2